MRVAVTGSSGLVGSRLVEWLLERGDEVLPIRRSGSDGLLWSPDGPVDLEPKDGVPIDAVVHLAGAPIAGKRWSESYKQEIRRSRVEGTRALVAGLAALQTPPKVLVSASAVAVYGPDHGQEELTEDDCNIAEPSDDFLTQVGRDWELEAAAYDAGRVVLLRLGIVLSSEGGALEKMVPPFKMFVGGPLGDGKQYMSWVELEDVVRGIGYVLDTAELEGPVNMTAPFPVTNRVFSTMLGRALGRPSFMPVPKFAVRLVAGGLADAALLVGHRVLPERLQASGFGFQGAELMQVLKRAVR